MKNILQLHEAPDPHADVDPLRASLEVKIREAGKVRAAAERHRVGVERTFDAVIAAEAALEKATAGVAKAQEAHVAAIAHAAAAGTPAPRSGVPSARQALTDAADELESQRSALSRMRADLPNWDKEVVLADTEVETAISVIFAPIAEQLIQRGAVIAEQLRPIRSALASLWGEPSPANHDEALAHEQGRRPLAETKKVVAEFLRSSSHVVGANPDPWSTARAILRENAHAELDALLSGKSLG